jgi:hypothetical protein
MNAVEAEMTKSREFGFKPKHYEVGYGRPPTHSRFVKGKSGNPKGKAKQYATFNALLAEELQLSHSVTLDGKQTYMLMAQLLIKKLIKAAAAGDKTMMKFVFDKCWNLPAPPDENIIMTRWGPEQERTFEQFLIDAETFTQEQKESKE